MTSSTLSSMPLRPSFHVSSTRTAYCSIVSGCVVGTMSTASCAPLRASNSASVCSSEARCSALSVPVRSLTRLFSGGTSTASAAIDQSSAMRSWSTRLLLRAEIHGRRLGDRLLVLDAELGLGLVAEEHRREVDRELSRQRVVLLHPLDVAL